MTLEVIGAGFGRTGTMSLKLALEELGFGPCYHMTEVFEHPEHVELWRAAGQGQGLDWDVRSSTSTGPRWTGPALPSTRSLWRGTLTPRSSLRYEIRIDGTRAPAPPSS